MKSVYKISIIFLLLTSCKDNVSNNKFAIKDFRQILQPYLIKAVSKGYVSYDTSTSFISKNATDLELRQLANSEHPILRAIALRVMLERPTIDHFNVLMTNLTDTAIVSIDNGEFGLKYEMVSDYMLQCGKWNDTLSKNKTINEIILKHNYLNSAYYKIKDIEKKQEYYPIVMQMIEREKSYFHYFPYTENALYALASYKKETDTKKIKEILLSNIWQLSETSFKLMKDFRSEAYLEIFEEYYKKYYQRKICKDQDISNAVDFIESVATYKNRQSESILNRILNSKPFLKCKSDSSYLKLQLAIAIRNNNCDEYSKIRKQVEPIIKEYELKSRISSDLIVEDVIIDDKDTSKEKVSWWK